MLHPSDRQILRVQLLFLVQAVWQFRFWVVRGFLILWLLGMVASPSLRLVLGPPQTVEGIHPHVCVHTDLVNEPDEWKTHHTLEMVRDMGAHTIVEFFPWAYFEPAHGQYQWDMADRIVSHAENQGLAIIARMGLIPAWARPEDSTFNTMTDSGMEAFADFVATFSARYAGRVDAVIIWNEPNLAFEWGFQPVDPADYVAMLEAVYPRVKAANPDMIVMGGALAPTLEPPGSPNGLNDLLYLDAMYQLGASDYFDVLAVHTYGFTEPADANPAPDTLNFRRVELLRDVMRRYGDEKPISITESGWNEHPRWTHAVRPSQRSAYTLDALRLAEQNWPDVQHLCLWIFRHPTPRGNHRDGFTLVTPDFVPRPIYHTIQAYAHGTSAAGSPWLPPPKNADE